MNLPFDDKIKLRFRLLRWLAPAKAIANLHLFFWLLSVLVKQETSLHLSSMPLTRESWITSILAINQLRLRFSSAVSDRSRHRSSQVMNSTKASLENPTNTSSVNPMYI
ncbi:unnamed protein product [Arabidopsis thaliana]|uniref:Transmembrane protein n=2 Tax=Arabidopsis thaliana TaxID=3702 RepID=A0A654FM37_ARATH|nr:uncharacterized protein AT4G06655 [Arabidopsis thaliana]ANM67058.1 transmembrane protein [Arabidopsis thaliana]CAA0393946.1 unnamed protein product [Arabidopsis thaliana]VYS61930.1 unnamed protein product [Arabidopsis thaliana]|eukprot:NP_001328911.1 transmembrane protein [Arabidopsis thaliana]